MDNAPVIAAPVVDAAALTDDQLLTITTQARLTAIQKLMPAGQLPADKEDREYLFKSLDGLDKIALTRKRIAADKETATGVTQAVGVIAHVLRQSKLNYNTVDVDAVVREEPVLDASVPEPDLVPGEIEVNPPQLDYESFVRKARGGSEEVETEQTA